MFLELQIRPTLNNALMAILYACDDVSIWIWKCLWKMVATRILGYGNGYRYHSKILEFYVIHSKTWVLV